MALRRLRGHRRNQVRDDQTSAQTCRSDDGGAAPKHAFEITTQSRYVWNVAPDMPLP